MNNKQVSDLLYTIADLLDIQDENFFKTRAYRMAAQTIAELDEDIETVVKEDRLHDLPHVGDAIAKKIHEYVTKGKLSYFEKLKEKTPIQLLDLLTLSGLGPKKIASLYHHLDITTIEELREACNQGKLRSLDGFGETTEKNILRAISLKEKTMGRSLLHHAYQQGKNYVIYLEKNPLVSQVSIAGSLRRMKETIGDIDILVSSDHPEEVMQTFIEYPQVKQILLQGKTKTSVLLQDNIQVDLRVVEQKSFGSALQYFTGSKEHNVALRGIAIKNGFKLNEYGLFDKKTNTFITGENEKAIYQKLQLSFIPAELRENRGEIEAGLQHRLPELITNEDIKGDLHIHSTYSDGAQDIASIAAAAEKQGYQYIGITDHSQTLHVAHGLTIERIQEKIKEIKKINQVSPVHIFCGTECDILADGSLDYDDDTLALFDYVGIGIHRTFNMSKKQATERIIQGMKHPSATFLTHPTCRIIGQRRAIELDIEHIFETALETNTSLEINSFPDRLDLPDNLVKRGKEMGVSFIIGSDAHTIDHLQFLPYGVAVARRGWLEKKDCLNTKTTDEIKTIFIT
mgnify:FL=1